VIIHTTLRVMERHGYPIAPIEDLAMTEEDARRLARLSDLTIVEDYTPPEDFKPYPHALVLKDTELTRGEVARTIAAFVVGTVVACCALKGFMDLCDWIGSAWR